MMTTKDEVQKMIDGLSDDCSIEDIQYHIYVHQKVKKGIKDAKEGRVLTPQEVEQRVGKWLKK